MKIGILGTGIVGNTIGFAMLEKNHEVMMGSRSAVNDKASQWVSHRPGRYNQFQGNRTIITYLDQAIWTL